MKKLRKFLVVSVMGLSVLAMSSLMALAPAPAHASASAGDLIKMAGLSSVYYLGADGRRYVFPNSTTYFSWYPDFSGVVTIPASELQSYPLGGNVTMNPGTKLVKITTDPSVYAVSPDGVLHKIGSEAQAAALYGPDWAKRVVDVPDAFFTNYTVGTPLADGQVPAGSLVKNAGSSNVYYYDGTNYRLIPSDAVAASNHFDLSNAITLTTTIVANGSNVASGEFADVSQSGGNGNVTVTGSGLMVSLNANTQPASTIISATTGTIGQSIAPLASFNMTAANDGAVTINSIRLHRIGVSSDNSLANVYLYDGTTKLTDAGTFSNGYVTFSASNGILTIPAGQTKTITVRADVAANVTGGNIGVEVQSASDIVATASAVTGSFPIDGNLMSITSVSDLATVNAGTVSPNGSGVTVNAGTMANTLWSSQLTVGQKAVKLSYVAFRQIGSVPADAIQNLGLFINGSQVGSNASIGSDGYVRFDLSNSPVTLNTGNSQLELRGDIVKGSNYNFIFSIQTTADIVLTDTNYNVNVALTKQGGGSLPLSASQTTINAGSVSIQKDVNFTATQFVANQAQTTLGQWTMKAYGEDMKIQQLKANLVFAGGNVAASEGFNNVTLYVNGGSVGSSQNVVESSTTDSPTLYATFGTTNLFTIPAGQTVTVTIKGDSIKNSGSTFTSVRTDLVTPASSEEGLTSFNYVPTNDTTYQGSALTAGSADATVSANAAYTNQNLSGNTLRQKIGSYTIQASSVDGVKVTSLNVGVTASTTLNDLANLYVVTPDMPNGSTPLNPASTNNFTTNFTIPANGTAQVDVYADLTNSNDTFTTTLGGNGLGTTSNQSVTLSAATGQTVVVGSGAMSQLSLSNSSPVKQIIVGGTNNQAIATYNFVASTAGGVNVTELGFTFASSTATSTAVSSVTVGGNTAAVVNGKALVSGLNLNIPAAYGGLDVPVTVNLAPVGLNGVSDQPVTMYLAHVKYLAGGSTFVDDSANAYPTSAAFGGGDHDNLFTSNTYGVASNGMQVAGVAPVVSLSAPANGSLTTGIVKVGSVTVVAPTGNVTLTDLPISLAASGATFNMATGTNLLVKDASNNSDIATSYLESSATTSATTTITFTTPYTISAGSAGKTFDIYANIDSITGSTSGSARVNLGMGSTSLFSWKDVTGNATLDGSYILNYPNTTVSFSN